MSPDDLQRWDDYVSGTTPADEVESVEEELFAAAARGDGGLRAWDRMYATAGAVLRVAGFHGSLTEGEAREVAQRPGVVLIDLDTAEGPPAEAAVDGELFILRVPLPLDGVRRLDMTFTPTEGEEFVAIRDIQLAPGQDAAYLACEATLFHATNVPGTLRFVDRTDGADRVLFELPNG